MLNRLWKKIFCSWKAASAHTQCVVVLMGGSSPERAISLKSGNAVLKSLLRQGFKAHGVDAVGEWEKEIARIKPDHVLILLHGQDGEDGTAHRRLDVMGIPYSGSGPEASALAMDKMASKKVFLAHQISTPPFALVDCLEMAEEAVQALGFPVCVKPNCSGSAIGLSPVDNASGLPGAFATANRYGDQVLIEPWIQGREFTVGILDEHVLPVIEIIPKQAFNNFAAKYEPGQAEFPCPADIDEALTQQIQRMSKRAFDVLGCYGWGRVDLMVDQNNQPWILEVNTIPGLTETSLVPTAACAAGMSFDQLVLTLLNLSAA